MNRLAGETSPYLLQHAANPVDWFPWGPEALARAREEDKPILLSVGYAACHCRHFVCIKVDREERPDIDGIYMDAVQAMTGQGGWPMTVFLTPDGEPFHAGTYYPKQDRLGMPSFRRVLEAVAAVWQQRRDDAREQGRRVAQHLAEQAQALRRAAGGLSDELLRQAFERLRRAFDPDWGGFGAAPKFPQPMTLEFLLRCHERGIDGARELVVTTLDRMAAGGIYDQLGGGFHRYSTDRRWLVPHFEKMLYDNAQLLRLYARAWQVTGEDHYARVARETGAYLLRELRHPEGGFCSSQDADSDGEEGRFFVWSWDELAGLAGEAVAVWYGASPAGNWEGRNVLWTPEPAAVVAERLGVSAAELARLVADARPRLFAARAARTHPGTDDKILAAWNGLAVAGLAEAGRVLGEPQLVDAAVAAAEFVLGRLRAPDGGLLRAWRAGRAGAPGYLDDYALVADGLLELYQTTFETRWFAAARALADGILARFADPDGGFFQTASDAERLLLRPREVFDNAVPSGSSAAAAVLLRLARLTGQERYERAAVGALAAVAELAAQAPTGFGHALAAADFALARVREVAIVGDPAAADTAALVGEVRRSYRPNLVVALARPGDATAAEVPLLAGREPRDGRATAYVCEHFACRLPVTDPEALAGQLAG